MIVYNIAVLLTCHNRKEKTKRAIESLLCSRDAYASKMHSIQLVFFLTDDGCIDGTIQMIQSTFPMEVFNIIQADGNAYWAGGMRLAWEEAMKSKQWDFYLLINDDVVFNKAAFPLLFAAHEYCMKMYGKGGMYSGFICDEQNTKKIIYGAKYYKNRLSRTYDLYPKGTPQECSLTNANILLVSSNVVDLIGILDGDYIHAGADWDYGLRARKAALPVLTTSGVCGSGINDHETNTQEREKVIKMSIEARRHFLNKPTREYYDGLVFFRKHDMFKYYLLKCAYFLNLYFPRLYYLIDARRS